MSVFFGVLLVIVAGLGWLFAVGLAIEWAMDRDTWPHAVVPMLVFAVPLAAVTAIVVTLDNSGVSSRALCLHGHQEWHSNGETSEKVWVCEAYEAER